MFIGGAVLNAVGLLFAVSTLLGMASDLAAGRSSGGGGGGGACDPAIGGGG